MKVTQQQRDEARAQLLKWLKPGDTVYTILRNVSRSGMQREIGLVIFHNGSDLHPNYSASILLGLRRGKNDGLVINGCGMDMGFEVVYRLGRALWPEGTAEPHSTRNGQPDSSGGYALKQRWL